MPVMTARVLLFAVALLALVPNAVAASPCDVAAAQTIMLHDYNAAGDGKSDDGPAIRAAVTAAAKAPKPAVIEFDAGKVYRVASFDDGYALQLLRAQGVVLRGNGAELSLLPPNKVLRIEESSGISICGLTIDYAPLPFTQGRIAQVDAAARTLDVDIDPAFAVPVADPDSVSDNSKAWRFAVPFDAGGRFTRRIEVASVHATSSPRRVRITSEQAGGFGRLRPGTNLVMALAGLGQTGGYAFRVAGSADIKFDSIRVYAVPQFSFVLLNNVGPVAFSNFEQRPRPSTTRAITGWRDVFHVKNNRAPLTWDGCHIEGTFDDAFNLSAIYQLAAARAGDDTWRLQDLSRVGEPPVLKAGDRLQAVDLSPQRKLLGEARIASVTQEGGASVVRLASPLPLTAGASRLIDLDAANAGSRIARCTVRGSMRLRSQATLEDSAIDGLLQIAVSPTVEGPIPRDIVVRNSELRGVVKVGPDLNLRRLGRREGLDDDWRQGERWVRNIVFDRVRFHGALRAQGASFSLLDSSFDAAGSRGLELDNCGPVEVRNLSVGGGRIDDIRSVITPGANMTPSDIVVVRSP